jgi:hypothetical protein
MGEIEFFYPGFRNARGEEFFKELRMGEEVLVAVIVGMGHTVKVAWNRCRRKSRAKAGNSRQAPGVGAVIVWEWPVISWAAMATAVYNRALP